MAKAKFPKKINGDASVTPDPVVSTSLPATQTNAVETTPEKAKAEPKKSANKPALVRTEARANLVPINLDDEIRRLAYLLSERRGFEPGHEAEDWLAAEREIRQRYHQQSA
jgi:DUF2934 family protein